MQETQYARSIALSKVVDTISNIVIFEKKCVIQKWIFKYEQHKYNMFIVVLDQSFINDTIYKHLKIKSIIY